MGVHALRVRLLGPVDGVDRPVAGLRRKAVLAILGLSAGETVGSDRIIDVVWGDHPPATAVNTLQSHVSYLRGVLGDRAAIVARPPGYLLDVPAEAIDAVFAERLVRQAEQSADHTERAGCLREALDLWRGPSLADVADVAWLHEQAERLEQLRLDATVALIDARMALGEHAQIVLELERLVQRYPFREHIQHQLMLALYRAGRQADALATYQRLRRTIGEELGIDPAPALRDLEAAILRQDAELAAPLPAVTVAPNTATDAAPVAVPAQLPLSLSLFGGREAELAELDAILAAAGQSPSVVTITAVSGTAGVGKTALAVYWAHRVAHRFPDGQLYVNLRGFDPSGSVMDPADAVRGFLDAFGVPATRIPAGPDAQASLYRSVLAGRRVLILVDNARDEEQARPLLPGSPGCLVVVTSRNQLAGLSAAEGAQPLALSLPSAAEAREILIRRLGANRVDAEPAATDSIISRCVRLPLALAVAAAHAATNTGLPLSALAAELHEAASALDPFNVGDPATDVRAVFSSSYRTLGTDAAAMFRRLGLCPGPDIGLPAAASLAGLPRHRARAILAELTRGNLLSEYAPGRYRFHDLLRAYAKEQAIVQDSDGERSEALRRLLDHYLHTAHAGAVLLGRLADSVAIPPPRPGVTPEQLRGYGGAVAWFAAEHAVLLASVVQSPVGLDDQVWPLAWAVGRYLDLYGYPDDSIAVQQAGLAAAQRLADPRALAYAHRGLGSAYVMLNRLAEAGAHSRQAIELFDQIGDQTAGARAHLSLSWMCERQGDPVGALSHAQRALAAIQLGGDTPGRAYALNTVGWCLAHVDEFDRALTYCREALTLFIEFDDRGGEFATWDSLGYIHFHLGDPEQGLACYQRALDGYRELGDRGCEAATSAGLGDRLEAIGDFDGARQAWQSALAGFEEMGQPAAALMHAKLMSAEALPAF